jgi:D-glycero-D-manno-heptose 1,7-bisphosphate phosphatase
MPDRNPNKKSAAVFFDRDGTLMEEVDYCSDPEKVSVFTGVREALARLEMAGFKNIIITNQAGIGRGFFTEQQYRAVETEVLRQIGKNLIAGSKHCPHAPSENCTCRKPLPRMVLEAATEYDIDLARSFFIGDKSSDIECGRNAGTRTILVQTGYGGVQGGARPDFVAKDVVTAVDIILKSADV